MAAELGDRHVRGIEAQGSPVRPARPGHEDAAEAARQAARAGHGRRLRLGPAGRHAAGPNALYQRLARRGRQETAQVDLDSLLALPRGERQAAIGELIRGRAAELLHYDGPADVPKNAKFAELGMDSLVSVEMKNVLKSALRVALPTSMIFDYPTLGELAEFIEQRLTSGRRRRRPRGQRRQRPVGSRGSRRACRAEEPVTA